MEIYLGRSSACSIFCNGYSFFPEALERGYKVPICTILFQIVLIHFVEILITRGSIDVLCCKCFLLQYFLCFSFSPVSKNMC